MIPEQPARKSREKIVVITGGVRRIGRATALAFARSNATVIITARHAHQEANATAQSITDAGGTGIAMELNVTDERDVIGFGQRLKERFGRLDILVNNAAVRNEKALRTMSLADWRAVMAVNLDGAFLCVRELVPLLESGNAPSIINIGGATAHTGAECRVHVAAAKAGLEGLTRALAVELSESGIRVNCVVPGAIGGRRSVTSGQSHSARAGHRNLIGREGSVDDVAEAIVGLCGPGGGFVTGQCLHVNGGLYFS